MPSRAPSSHEEVRYIEEVGPIDLPKADPRMLDIAEKFIDQQRGDSDPSPFVDRYEQRQVIDRDGLKLNRKWNPKRVEK